MIDKNFYNYNGNYNLEYIAKVINCKIIPPKLNSTKASQVIIKDISTIEQAKTGNITFLNNLKYLTKLQTSNASACIINKKIVNDNFNDKIWLLASDNPYHSFQKAIDLFYSPKISDYSIPSTVCIHKTAIVGSNCIIGCNVIIEENVVIGKNSIIGHNTAIKHGVKIGENANIATNVSISHAIIGKNVVILAGARIGEEGFGIASHQGQHNKIFHIGRVIIGDQVEIGANTTIDRGSIQDTVIGDYCKIDNLVQIGHNVKLGKGVIIVAQAGIAGSTYIGDYSVIGGQAGITGHLNIGHNVQIAAQSGVIKDLKDGMIVGGSPSIPINDWHKQSIILKNLIKKEK